MPDRLAEQAKILADRVSALSTAVDKLDRRTGRSEKTVALVVFGLLLDLALSLTVGIVLFQLNAANNEIRATQAREAQTRQEALCPLYGLILGSYNPNSRPEGEARDKYVQQFDIMRTAYAALDCTGPAGDLVPPRTPR